MPMSRALSLSHLPPSSGLPKPPVAWAGQAKTTLGAFYPVSEHSPDTIAGLKISLRLQTGQERHMRANPIVALVNRVPRFVATPLRDNERAKRAVRPWLNRLLPSGPTSVVVRSSPAYGLRLLIYPREEKYYWTGSHELPVQEALQRLLRPGMTFWDVGAHIGFFSCLASRLVGARGRVVAFEPQDDNRQRLIACLGLNRIENVTVSACALASTSGSVVLHAHQSSLMWSLIDELGKEEGLMVTACSLDDAARAAPLPQVIKVDVEGAELDVLRGGATLLAGQKPTLIVEFSNEDLLAEAQNLYPFYSFESLTLRHWLLEAR
jgi:FkbM family methyltransferase